MNGFVHHKYSGWAAFKNVTALVLFLCLSAAAVLADGASFTNLVVLGEQAGQRGDVVAAQKSYAAAESLAATNCPELCILARHYCDLMYQTSSQEIQKNLAQVALACAQRAVKVDSKNATAHLSVAVCYAKNFPFVDNSTKVNWSKAMKTECETGIALDQKQDIGYYILGRWHYGTANMGFFTRGLVKIVYGGLPEASNEEAIKNYKKAIELAPNRIIHHMALANVYEATGEKKLELAELQKCRTLKPLDPDDVQAQKDAIAMLAKLGS